MVMAMVTVVPGGVAVQTVSKSHLKAHMLAIFRRLEDSGEALIVTDRGRPVLKIEPVKHSEDVAAVFADVRGRVALPDDAELEACATGVWDPDMELP